MMLSLSFHDTIPEHLDRLMSMEDADRNWICPYSRERHRQCMASEAERHVSIFRRDDGELVGFLILLGLDSPHRTLKFRRIVIAEKGRGYGHCAMRWVQAYCFEELHFHRLWLDVFVDNERAVNLYEAEGFRKEGQLRDAIRTGEAYRSLYIFSILEEEYYLLKKNSGQADGSRHR